MTPRRSLHNRSGSSLMLSFPAAAIAPLLLFLLLDVAFVPSRLVHAQNLCNSSLCEFGICNEAAPYLCVVGSALGACSTTPWTLSPICRQYCDFRWCLLDCKSPCTPEQCAMCPSDYGSQTMCTAGIAKDQCGADNTWSPTVGCTECCNVSNCVATPVPGPPPGPTPSPPSLQCSTPCAGDWCSAYYCAPASPLLCMAGVDAGTCMKDSTFWPTGSCTECCNFNLCSRTPSTPSPVPTTAAPLTNPPILTPVPGWTESPTDFPAATPLPVMPPTTPVPNPQCPDCDAAQCASTSSTGGCSLQVPFLCLQGASVQQCDATPVFPAGCIECCDFRSCLPPPPPPFPSSPWSLVPPSNNCTLWTNNSIPYAPNPSATPYGGIDVSPYGCRANVSPSCCGETPRFNWIVTACNADPAKRHSVACNHTSGNNSRTEVYYIKAYQWNSDTEMWTIDPTSSVQATAPGDIVDFFALGMNLTHKGDWQDWDFKFGPTTATTQTAGLGPPAMMFLMSAKHFFWSTFYVMNQIVLNRGPGGEVYPDNCWSSSAGEFDLLEPPFWSGVELPGDRLYMSKTQGAGRCMPIQKAVGSRFQKECSEASCCETCSCGEGMTCFGESKFAGYEAMGCIPADELIPNGTHRATLDGSVTACGAYFGATAGGEDSTAYFIASDAANASNTEFIVAAVIDADGVTLMRWPSADATYAASVWPGVSKYSADDTLPVRAAAHIHVQPPCLNFTTPCAIYEPSCDDDCVINTAAGNFGEYQMPGAYSAEAARDGLNWWNLFVSTNQTAGLKSHQLPMFSKAPTVPIPTDRDCNRSCSYVVCHNETRCPTTTPFQCTQGDAYGLCSNTSTYWFLDTHCAACCDVKTCGDGVSEQQQQQQQVHALDVHHQTLR